MLRRVSLTRFRIHRFLFKTRSQVVRLPMLPKTCPRNPSVCAGFWAESPFSEWIAYNDAYSKHWKRKWKSDMCTCGVKYIPTQSIAWWKSTLCGWCSRPDSLFKSIIQWSLTSDFTTDLEMESTQAKRTAQKESVANTTILLLIISNCFQQTCTSWEWERIACLLA